MPTQVSAMLGSIVRLDNKNRPCGVYGSFGWSGEAVDKLNTSLADAGFPMAFKPIKVQFRPTAKNIQVRRCGCCPLGPGNSAQSNARLWSRR